MLRAERQSARMSKITNDGLTRTGTGCFIAVPIWQQWVSKGLMIWPDLCDLCLYVSQQVTGRDDMATVGGSNMSTESRSSPAGNSVAAEISVHLYCVIKVSGLFVFLFTSATDPSFHCWAWHERRLLTVWSECLNCQYDRLTCCRPLKPFDAHCCHILDTAIKHPVPDRVKLSFAIFDIRALWRSGLSVRVPRCQMTLNPVWHRMLYSCIYHMATVGVKGLMDL